MKRVITEEVVQREASAGRTRIAAPRGDVIITPSAYDRARALGVTFDEEMREASSSQRTNAGRAVSVKGDSVVLGKFDAAGHEIGLTDVVTSKDGSPMTAGFMSWTRAENFPWTLGYDEIDYVIEGELHIRISGQTLVAKAGDVVYIPKNSSIVFATPTRVKVFYVTYPADWQPPK